MQTLEFHMHAHVYTYVALYKQTCYMHTIHTHRERTWCGGGDILAL